MKVLQVIYGLHVGGAESFLYNLLEGLDENIFRVDIVIQDANITNKKLELLCKKRKIGIYIITKFNKNVIKHARDLKRILDLGYDVVHIHVNALVNIIPVIMANKVTSKVIIHSHSTKNNSGGIVARWLHLINRSYINRLNIIALACGKEAGMWMFKENKFFVVPNAVNISEYKYNEEKRKKIRKEKGLYNEYVIGHVGRFVEAKNHSFLLKVFAKYKEKNEGKLLLVGDGLLKENVVRLAEELKIIDSVVFCGECQNVNEYYSAFDCVIMPSIYEGLPFSLIEAQMAGLRIIASTSVSEEANFTGNIVYIDLEENIEKWVEQIVYILENNSRNTLDYVVENSKYNVVNMIKMIESIYQEGGGNIEK